MTKESHFPDFLDDCNLLDKKLLTGVPTTHLNVNMEKAGKRKKSQNEKNFNQKKSFRKRKSD